MKTTLHPSWQKSLSAAITDISALYALLEIPPEMVDGAIRSFPLRVPREFVARMEKGNPRDPLLLQVLPKAIELHAFPGFSQNPLKEQSPIPGLLHKYPHRVLLTLTGGCAINCRYCFRRHFPYEDNLPSQKNFKRMLDYIQADHSIDEVIFSGGDPLVLKDDLLNNFIFT